MRFMKIMFVVAVCVMGLSVLASAGQNQSGVADTRQIRFDNPVWVGDTLLPSGDYKILHTMQGDTHIMVFEQKSGKEEVRVKCTLVPLQAKAERTETAYTLNDKNERVLHGLTFRGDNATHQF
ncbi:MAG: hypothetical protein ACXVZH_03905 [Terriglobales bacterium]